MASVAGKTAILLPWETEPSKQEDRKVSSADLKNGRVQDQKGYHRLQSHTSGSSVVTSTTAVKDVSTVTLSRPVPQLANFFSYCRWILRKAPIGFQPAVQTSLNQI